MTTTTTTHRLIDWSTSDVLLFYSFCSNRKPHCFNHWTRRKCVFFSHDWTRGTAILSNCEIVLDSPRLRLSDHLFNIGLLSTVFRNFIMTFGYFVPHFHYFGVIRGIIRQGTTTSQGFPIHVPLHRLDFFICHCLRVISIDDFISDSDGRSHSKHLSPNDSNPVAVH